MSNAIIQPKQASMIQNWLKWSGWGWGLKLGIGTVLLMAFMTNLVFCFATYRLL